MDFKIIRLRLDTKLKQQITATQAYHFRIIPFDFGENYIKFYSDNTEPDILASELSILLGKKIKIELLEEKEINNSLTENYRQSSLALENQKFNYTQNFLEQLLLTATSYNCSDIHFEVFQNNCRIRFRIDGKLKEEFTISKLEYPQLINQIKIKANLDISQKRLPQDGRITFNDKNYDFDIRVSTLPTLHGEKIVLRILQKDTQNIELKNLGFTNNELNIYYDFLKATQGILLISGPTGSGKTTTLYGTLKKLNTETKNIVTIEDPIEYTLEGINQVQLKEDIGLNFPSALRTFLRQDPDVIMVGEIRDEQTANMAIKAALTGHLVLSTIHTNSAWDTISRLIDMGIPPYLISSTLKISMAQRLVRKLCEYCNVSHPLLPNDNPSKTDLSQYITHHHKATGCNKCHFTGYKGRIAIYEIIPIDKELIAFINSNKHDITDYFDRKKINTLKTNAIRLLKEGTTSIEEVYHILNT